MILSSAIFNQFQIEQIEQNEVLVDVRFLNRENFRRFYELNATNTIEIRTFMALPDVDDTDEIIRMTENDFSNKTFKNVGLRVSLF